MSIPNSLTIPSPYPKDTLDFSGGSDDKESSCNTGDTGLIPGLGGCPGGRNGFQYTGNPLQYTCQENPTDRGAWRATVHRVAKSQTCLK